MQGGLWLVNYYIPSFSGCSKKYQFIHSRWCTGTHLCSSFVEEAVPSRGRSAGTRSRSMAGPSQFVLVTRQLLLSIFFWVYPSKNLSRTQIHKFKNDSFPFVVTIWCSCDFSGSSRSLDIPLSYIWLTKAFPVIKTNHKSLLRDLSLFEVDRKAEYSPLIYMSTGQPFNRYACKKSLMNLHFSWLINAGARFKYPDTAEAEIKSLNQ